MCGRYVLFSPAEHLAGLLGLDLDPSLGAQHPRYNIAPTQTAPIVRMRDGRRVLSGARWGLIPSWVKDVGDWPTPINTRAETGATRPASREAMRSRRCLAPADGFYEWQKPEGSGGAKQAMLIRASDDEVFLMAGVWERWRDRSDEVAEWVDTFSILTTSPNDLLRPIHDRMPVIVGREDAARWLDPSIEDPARVADLLAPVDASMLRAHPVSSRVNSVRNDDPSLIAPVQGTIPERGLFG